MFAGGGEMGELMRATDWSKTEFGPVEHWPKSLHTVVGILPGSRFPMMIWWGSHLLNLYNDGYRPILRDKHPASLGVPAEELWTEVWDFVGPLARGVIAGGPATWMEDLQLLRLVTSLLDFARIESGHLQLSFMKTDVSTLTADLVSSFRSLIEQTGITFTIDRPPIDDPIYVDSTQWEKIVLNLMSNAFKFTFHGEITVGLHRNSDRLHVTVQDTGSGISASELPYIFERFRRVEGATGRSFEGTGIGLALVQELVKLHGGSVHVLSTEGKGTMFEVVLPVGYEHLPVSAQGGEEAVLEGMHTGVDDYLVKPFTARELLTRIQMHLDLVHLCQERASLADLRANNPERKIDSTVAEGLVLEADPRLVTLLLENLLGNAWKFTPKQPRSYIEVGMEEYEGREVLFVRDNGAEFNMEYAKKLFTPFQRLHTQDEFQGTGIGLATVHRVVTRHGGRIWADASPHEGASFFLPWENPHDL